MRKSRFTETQIIGMIKEQEAGLTVAEVGPVAYSCSSKWSFRPLGVRRPTDFFLPMLNVGGVGYRNR